MIATSAERLPKYFIITMLKEGCLEKQYRVLSGIIENDVKEFYDMRPIDMSSIIYRVKKEFTYNDVEVAKEKALKLIEKDRLKAIDALETSVKLLKLN